MASRTITSRLLLSSYDALKWIALARVSWSRIITCILTQSDFVGRYTCDQTSLQDRMNKKIKWIRMSFSAVTNWIVVLFEDGNS